MDKPLMPKAVAVWMVDNTVLTFDQIANFCGMHPLEVKGIADGEVAQGIMGISPVTTQQITLDELKEAESNPNIMLNLNKNLQKKFKTKKVTKYTPVARRQDKPDAISWFLKNYPTVKDSQLVKLLGTTKSTINNIREKSHWNIQNIRPKDPVLLGVCTQSELDNVIAKIELEKNKNSST